MYKIYNSVVFAAYNALTLLEQSVLTALLCSSAVLISPPEFLVRKVSLSCMKTPWIETVLESLFES